MKNIYCSFIIGALFISGCNEPSKSRDWYEHHHKEMNERYTECKKSGDDTPDCRNAKEAHFNVSQLNAPILNFNELLKESDSKSKP